MPRVAARRRTTSSQHTRERLIKATRALLAREGFAGTTARAIGQEAGCNQALVFYHFGTLNELHLTALDASGQERMNRYREALEGVRSLRQLRALAPRLYAEDRESGHVTILAELVAGGLVDKELGAAVATRIQPWVDLVEEALRRALPSAALRRRLPLPQVAYAAVATFLGLEILGQLANDHTRSQEAVHKLSRTARLTT
jgi:AcrR family transcriptional regulator